MKKILTMTAAHPWPVLLVILLVSLTAASQLHRLQMHVSPQALTIENDPAKAFYERSLATFGADDITLLFIRDRDLFERGRLEAIRGAITRLEALPFVESTDSLFSLPHIRVVDDFVSTDPYLQEIPETSEQAEHLRQTALRNPFIRHNLLSDDGTAMAINLRLRRSSDDPAFDAEVATAIEAAITPLKPEVEEVFQLGLPYLRTQVRDAIQLDQKTLLPLSVLVLLITLSLIFRGAGAALLPLLTAGISVLWTLGGMAALGIPLNVMTAVVPVLLIIIGSTEDIHLISEYQAGMIAGYGRRRAVHYMARRLGLAVLLTFFTSYLGFLSIAVNPIQLLREFGLVASTGLALNFLITASLVPVYLRFCGRRCTTARKKRSSGRRERIIDRVSRLVLKRKRRIMLLTLAVCAIAAYGSLSVGVNNNILDYFHADSPVQYRVQTLHQELAGMESFSILLDGDIEGTFQRSRYLEEISEIQDYLRRSADFDSSLSVTDSLSLFNSAVNDSGELELPNDDEVLAELTSLIDREHIDCYVSADFSQARILVRHNLGDSQALNKALESLQSFIDERTDTGLHVYITGESILTNRAADRMALGQAKSLGLMLLVIFVVISLLFLNMKAGLLAIVPNLLPVVMLFGVMGFAGIPLDSGTSMIAAIALGICMDNTMHFMVRYNRELARRKDATGAIEATMRAEAMPITTATIALSLGLGVLIFSSFTPVAYFGLLSSMVILLAYYANFFITPILLSATRLVTLWDLLSIDLRRELINNCGLFQGMRPRQVKRVILMSEVRAYQTGETIMRRGDGGKELFVLLEGRGEIRTGRPGAGPASVTPVQAGQVFGLTALLCGRPRLSALVTLEECKVLVLTWESIQRSARLYPRSACHLFRNLSVMLGVRFADDIPTPLPMPVNLHELEANSPQSIKQPCPSII